jgi:hypothetical protein
MLIVGAPMLFAVEDDAVALALDFLLNIATATPPAAAAITPIKIHFFAPDEPPDPDFEMVTAGVSPIGVPALEADFLVEISTPGRVIGGWFMVDVAVWFEVEGSVPGAGGFPAAVGTLVWGAAGDKTSSWLITNPAWAVPFTAVTRTGTTPAIPPH